MKGNISYAADPGAKAFQQQGLGYFSDAQKQAVFTVENQGIFLQKREPMGQVMSNFQKATDDVEKLANALMDRTHDMVAQADTTAKAINSSSAKIRDSADKLGAAIEKFNKIASCTNFAESAKNACSLVESLERLAKLQQSGVLDKVMVAISAEGKNV